MYFTDHFRFVCNPFWPLFYEQVTEIEALVTELVQLSNRLLRSGWKLEGDRQEESVRPEEGELGRRKRKKRGREGERERGGSGLYLHSKCVCNDLLGGGCQCVPERGSVFLFQKELEQR